MKIDDLRSRSISWKTTGDAEIPYSAIVEGKSFRIRVNDFPADNLYTLLSAGAEFNFDEWPASWLKTPAKKITKPNPIRHSPHAKAI